jgi:hypothetical protein
MVEVSAIQINHGVELQLTQPASTLLVAPIYIFYCNPHLPTTFPIRQFAAAARVCRQTT